MAKRTLETDFLVVGCGAAGMAFADALIDASRAENVRPALSNLERLSG
jgi:hypothetical protein